MESESKNQVQIWAFESQAVRIHDREGNPWFVASDICRIWGIHNCSDAVRRLDDDEKGVVVTDTLGGPQEMVVISESGLYSLAGRSRKDAPKRFCKWVRSDVLPTLRKTGTYTIGQPKEPAAPSLTEAMDRVSYAIEALVGSQVETKQKVAEVETKVSEVEQQVSEVEKKFFVQVNQVSNVEQLLSEQNDRLAAQAAEIAELKRSAPPRRHLTLNAYCRWKGIKLDADDTILKFWGGRLKSRCKKLGIETHPVPDPKHGFVNAYPIDIIESTFDELGPHTHRPSSQF